MNSEVNKVSTRDVAAAAGVSATLVSWVAKGTATQHRISEATQRRVRATMEQLGYRPAGPAGPAVVGCSVDKLLSERPADSLFPFPTTQQPSNSTTSRASGATQQLNNLTTLLSSVGYRLVAVENGEELSRLPREGLVGILYRKAPFPSPTKQPDNLTTLPPPVAAAERASHIEDMTSEVNGAPLVSQVLPVSEVVFQPVEAPAPMVEPLAARSGAPVVTAVPAVVSQVELPVVSHDEPVAPVNEVVLTEQNPPLSEPLEVASAVEMEGAALSAPVSEVVPQPVESPAPPVEPVAAPTPTTPEVILEVAPILVSTPPVVLTEQNPPLSETPPSVSEVASTLVAEPVAEPEVESPAPSPSTTEQPDNLTTAPAFSQMEGAALSAPVSRESVEVTTPASEARNPVSEVVPQPVESPAPPVEPVAAPTPTSPEAILEVAPIPASMPPVVLTEQNPPLSETPPSVSEVAADVSAAEVADDDPPGTNAAGTSASTSETEPEVESPAPSPSTTEQPDNLTTAPAFSQMEGAALSAPVSRESVEVTTPASDVVPQPVESPAPPVEPVAAPTPTTPEVILEVAPIPASMPPVVLTEQNPPLSETPPSVSEVAADVPAAEVADDDPPGTNAAGTSASTLVAEPEVEPEVESPAPPPETSMPTAPQA